MKKYRYILSGLALGKDKISNFRLIGANNVRPVYSNESAIRVNIPDDLVLERYSCDSYSTTTDSRTLDELGYDILIWNRFKKKYFVRNDLKGKNPCDFNLRYE